MQWVNDGHGKPPEHLNLNIFQPQFLLQKPTFRKEGNTPQNLTSRIIMISIRRIGSHSHQCYIIGVFLLFFFDQHSSLCLKNCECFTTNGTKYLIQLISYPQQRFVALEQGPLFFWGVTVPQSGNSIKQRIGPTTRMSWKCRGMQRQSIPFLTFGLSQYLFLSIYCMIQGSSCAFIHVDPKNTTMGCPNPMQFHT